MNFQELRESMDQPYKWRKKVFGVYYFESGYDHIEVYFEKSSYSYKEIQPYEITFILNDNLDPITAKDHSINVSRMFATITEIIEHFLKENPHIESYMVHPMIKSQKSLYHKIIKKKFLNKWKIDIGKHDIIYLEKRHEYSY